MQKRTSIIVAVIVGLALTLTLYGGQQFLSIKTGHHRAVEAQNEPIIQLGLPNEQMISTQPAWTLTRQTAAIELPARGLDTVRVGPALSVEEFIVQDDMGHFFIAGIILEEQSKDVEERTMFFNDDRPQIVEAGYVHPTNNDLAIN